MHGSGRIGLITQDVLKVKSFKQDVIVVQVVPQAADSLLQNFMQGGGRVRGVKKRGVFCHVMGGWMQG